MRQKHFSTLNYITVYTLYNVFILAQDVLQLEGYHLHHGHTENILYLSYLPLITAQYYTLLYLSYDL